MNCIVIEDHAGDRYASPLEPRESLRDAAQWLAVNVAILDAGDRVAVYTSEHKDPGFARLDRGVSFRFTYTVRAES